MRAAKRSLDAPNDQSGSAVKCRNYNDAVFGPSSATTAAAPAPYQYAWTEQYDSGSNTLADKPDGRSGTTSAAFAVSAWEQSGVYTAPPWPALPSGTLVWMQMSFDSASPANPVYRFCAPPEFSESDTLTLPHGSWRPGRNHLDARCRQAGGQLRSLLDRLRLQQRELFHDDADGPVRFGRGRRRGQRRDPDRHRHGKLQLAEIAMARPLSKNGKPAASNGRPRSGGPGNPCCCSRCPSDAQCADACADTLTVSVAGMAPRTTPLYADGYVLPDPCCEPFNGTYTLTRLAEPCTWSYQGTPSGELLDCDATVFLVSCVVEVDGAPHWQIAVTFEQGYYASVFSEEGYSNKFTAIGPAASPAPPGSIRQSRTSTAPATSAS